MIASVCCGFGAARTGPKVGRGDDVAAGERPRGRVARRVGGIQQEVGAEVRARGGDEVAQVGLVRAWRVEFEGAGERADSFMGHCGVFLNLFWAPSPQEPYSFSTCIMTIGPPAEARSGRTRAKSCAHLRLEGRAVGGERSVGCRKRGNLLSLNNPPAVDVREVGRVRGAQAHRAPARDRARGEPPGEAAKVVLGADVRPGAEEDEEAEVISEPDKALEIGARGPRELAGVWLVDVPGRVDLDRVEACGNARGRGGERRERAL